MLHHANGVDYVLPFDVQIERAFGMRREVYYAVLGATFDNRMDGVSGKHRRNEAPGLPLRPWWHHPGRLYEGRHRGMYRHGYKAVNHQDHVCLGTVTANFKWYGVVCENTKDTDNSYAVLTIADEV